VSKNLCKLGRLSPVLPRTNKALGQRHCEPEGRLRTSAMYVPAAHLRLTVLTNVEVKISFRIPLRLLRMRHLVALQLPRSPVSITVICPASSGYLCPSEALI
jgi:hypothetical protein